MNETATPRRDRSAYLKRYYAKNRKKRLAYQRKYDRKHKEKKAAYMAKYRHYMRHGYHLVAFQGMPGVPVISEEEKERRLKNRAYILFKDTEYRCAAYEKKWAEDHPEEAAEHDAQYARWLEVIKDWDWETQGMAPSVFDC
jgi:hypothetical protein